MVDPAPAPTPDTTLGPDAARALTLAAQSLFDTFGRTAMGAMVVDREHRIVWIDDGYRRFLPALGHAEDDFIGRRVQEVVPNTLMRQVIDSGQPILVDLLSNQAGTFLVTRLPLRDDQGVVIGAVGFVLLDHAKTTMLEAEFLGVAPGAYTGARRKGRDGKFKVGAGTGAWTGTLRRTREWAAHP